MSKNDLIKFLNFWFPVIVYSAIIFYASSVPRLEIPVKMPLFDKLVHVIEYGILGFLFARAYATTARKQPKTYVVLLTLLFCFLYGFSDEIHQFFVPGRMATFGDVVADGIGGALGGLVYKT